MGKIVWITGAGTGIGKAIAKQYDQAENTLILSSRKRDVLEAFAKELQANTVVMPLDVSDANAVNGAVDQVINSNQRVDILYNNAGVSQRSLAAETKTEIGRKIMDVNFFGSVNMTTALLPHMLKQNSGQIVAISSLSGKFGFPQRSFYAASKHAMQGYFESLSLELKDSNVQVLIASPGRINTNISLNALKGSGEKHGTMDKAQEKGMPADICAKKIKRALESGKKEVYVGGKEVLMIYIKRFFPGLFRFIAARIDPNA